MKRIISVLLLFMLTLSGCVFKSPAPSEVSAYSPSETSENITPETSGDITSEATDFGEKNFKTGFYGKLFPNDFQREDEGITWRGITLRKITHGMFNLYHAHVGPYANGSIFCEEKDYSSAKAFYNDPGNYTYRCILGDGSLDLGSKIVELPNIDIEKFEELLDFADENCYDPFGLFHNMRVKKLILPMPDRYKDTRMVFYKESVDSLFVSTTGHHFYILENSLYLVYQYNTIHGKYERLIAVKAPEEISTYFIEYMKPYL